MNVDSIVNAGPQASLDRSNINNDVKQFVIDVLFGVYRESLGAAIKPIDITSSTLFGIR